MLDSLQATQLQSAIVKAMYAATIESELDTEKAFEYIAGAPQGQQDNPLINILEKFTRWYDTNNVTLGGVKIPHLFSWRCAEPADSAGFRQWIFGA